MLTEMSVVDSLKYNTVFPQIDILKNERKILYSVYYMYYIKIRLTLVTPVKSNFTSIENIYKNAN